MLTIRLVATVRIAAWWTFAEWQTVAGHPWTLFGPISQLRPHFENNGTPTENRADGYVSDAIFFISAVGRGMNLRLVWAMS